MHPHNVASWTAGDLEQLAALPSDNRPEAVPAFPYETGLCEGSPTGDPRPQDVVAHLEDDLPSLGPPAAENAGEVRLRLGRCPHGRHRGLRVEHDIDQLSGQGHGLGTRGAVGEDDSPNPVLAPDP